MTDALNKTHPGGVFTGDTLFIAGCGRFFEGTGGEMIKALNYLSTLPDETVVYNGHEYTAGSLSFGKHVDPHNVGLDKLAGLVKENEITTGLTTIGDEKTWNVFMRLNSEAVRQVVPKSCGKPILNVNRQATSASADTSDSEIMDLLREQKNNYRG